MESMLMEEEIMMGILSGMASGIPSTLLSIATYVLTALALYTVAKRRGLNRPWMAWIPVVNCWLIGSLSDQYRYVVKNEIKSKRKALLTLNIISAVLSIAVVVICIAMVVGIVMGAVGGSSEEAMMEAVLGPAIGMLGMSLPLIGVTIAYAIIYYMALYDIYKSMDPSNCVLFLVLSILFSVTTPFFLFFNRNKDLGMPPRRQEYVYREPAYIPPESTWQPQEPPRESWEQENKDYL